MILVTGANGMVGTHLIYKLANFNKKLRLFVRNKNKIDEIKHSFRHFPDGENVFEKLQIEWIFGDITDLFSVKEAVCGVEDLYHIAAKVSFNPRDTKNIFRTNIDGTAHIVNAALQAGVKRFCYVSSIAALGTAENFEAVDEESEYNPEIKVSPYSYSKFRAELEVWRGIAEGLNAVIVNPSVILGAGDWNSSSAVLISNIAKGFRFYTKGTTGFIDVFDVVELMIRLMQTDKAFGNRYVLSANNLSYKEVFDAIASELMVEKPSIYATPFVSEIAWRIEALKTVITRQSPRITVHTARSAHKISAYSSKKIIDLFDYNFIPFNQTIKRIVGNYKAEN